MPAKWQQWMPFHIDRFKGSLAVQAMHPAARSGYLYLLSAAWQKEDCTLPNDDEELAIQSGLGAKLWAQFRKSILRNFETLENGSIRNEVVFSEWSEAKRIYEKRWEAAKSTVKIRRPRRSSNGDRDAEPTPTIMVTVEQSNADRDTGTGTGTGTGTEQKQGEDSPEREYDFASDEIPEGLSPLRYASGLLETCSLPQAFATQTACGAALEAHAKEHSIPLHEAVEDFTSRIRGALAAGETVNRFWFEDGKYRTPPSRAQPGYDPASAQPEMTEAETEFWRKKGTLNEVKLIQAMLP